jgi:hypothetical protein
MICVSISTQLIFSLLVEPFWDSKKQSLMFYKIFYKISYFLCQEKLGLLKNYLELLFCYKLFYKIVNFSLQLLSNHAKMKEAK